MSTLTAWLTAPAPETGVHLAADTEGWHFSGYPELASSSRRVASALAGAGVRPGDAVALLLPTGYPMISAVFGVFAAGGAICPVAPPSFRTDEDYIAHVASILEQAAPVLTVTTDEFAPLVAGAMERAGRPGAPWRFREGRDELEPRAPGDIALLQFTSGSTGAPRGVRVSWDNLHANFRVLERISGWQPGDGVASWLPLHHDMGLIGCFLFPVARQAPLWLMRPEQFIRRPERWLGCFTPGKAVITASPSFAFAYAARRVRPQWLEGADLSQWRSVCVGAETTDVAALEAFARLAAGTGLSAHTFQPSYGLAENTLAVTSPPVDRVPRIVLPEWSGMRMGAEVPIVGEARLGEWPGEHGPGWLIGHGRPQERDGIRIRVVDDGGGTLPDGHLGEIAVTGSSVADGYHAGREAGSSRFVDGELRTGDAGFFHRDDLYVLGRMGESLKLRGRHVYVEDLDIKVAATAGLARSRVLVVSTVDRGRAGVVVFAETRPGRWADDVVGLLRTELGPEPSITVVAGRRGLISKTSSGKPRRRWMWQRLHHGELTHAHVQAYGPG
ncbi:AMP-binding protein [Streptomyces sp. NPDC051776]|uniref:AMP-binding protein n=1 Tax=Streptomyces sp. NPDC051776 TaxID=3155414 RepID=UPI00341F96EC